MQETMVVTEVKETTDEEKLCMENYLAEELKIFKNMSGLSNVTEHLKLMKN